MPFGHHSSLWLKATTFLKSQRGYSGSKNFTVHCGQRLQQLRGHSGEICWHHYTRLNPNAAVAAAATPEEDFKIQEQKCSNGIYANTILNYK